MTDIAGPVRPDAFNRLGTIARGLLESLRELGFDRSLGAVAAEGFLVHQRTGGHPHATPFGGITLLLQFLKAVGASSWRAA